MRHILGKEQMRGFVKVFFLLSKLAMASNKLINGETPGDMPNHHTERDWHLKTRDKVLFKPPTR